MIIGYGLLGFFAWSYTSHEVRILLELGVFGVEHGPVSNNNTYNYIELRQFSNYYVLVSCLVYVCICAS
jgi:hypothetical protein